MIILSIGRIPESIFAQMCFHISDYSQQFRGSEHFANADGHSEWKKFPQPRFKKYSFNWMTLTF